MTNFIRVGSDHSAAMANTADLGGDSLVEFHDHSRDTFSLSEVACPHQCVINRLNRDKLYAESEIGKLIDKNSNVTNTTRLRQMNAAIVQAQLGIDYEIAIAANTNLKAAEDKQRARADLEEQYAHQQAVFAELEAARKKRIYG